jgi:isochorismate pyruvate lyase
MTKSRVAPAECRNMEEVRYGVDRLDEQIVALLAERFRYMDAAARIKPDRAAVRDEWRKADVISKVRAAAEQEGAPVDRVALLYEALVEASIAYEFGRYDALRSVQD